MDNVKMPFLPEEALKTQRVEVYLNDLKERLKELRVQHDEVIKNSVEIIKEIDEVSSGLLHPQNNELNSTDNVTKIKRLIKEFETVKESNSNKMPVSIESKVDIRRILQNFEKLNESHVLKESLVLLKRAKESLEKIDIFLGTNLENVITQSVHVGQMNKTFPSPTVPTLEVDQSNDSVKSMTSAGLIKATIEISPKKSTSCDLAIPKTQTSTTSNSSLQYRINLFNNENTDRNMSCINAKKITPSCYASCCSSVTSIDVYKSTENFCTPNLSNEGSYVNSLEMGYEGDNDDSEYDLFALKRKKK
ncbi:uncharacterized protein LOC101449067 [Ceratitis capitata]|uniref:Uncharacterized protein n=2 Tax=Ceratitis capitata TaxID=7213 RepID=W8BNW9_CERCA|nr:uncharacterized protein LOC101449067 [Ceratitis capitata]